MNVEWKKYDVLVIGSGGAGSHAAHAASNKGASVLVVSKDPLGVSDTKISEGLATVRESGSNDDSVETLSENIKMAGADLSIESLTNAFSQDSKLAYDKYRENGLRPTISLKSQTPKPLPLPLGGHTRRRTVGHNNSGIAFAHANWNAIVSKGEINYKEDCWIIDIIVDKKTVIGAVAYDAQKGIILAIQCPSVIIAAGGLSTIYFPKTDTLRGNTGDSYALAVRAGADMVDMEQIQFLPFCLTSPPSYEGLLAGEPVTASFLGVLRDKNKNIILDSVFLRTRAQCSEAIMKSVEKGNGTINGGAFLDMSANKRAPKSGPYFMEYLKTSLPSAYNNVRQALSKPASQCDELWEVRPGAHYMMGGLRVNEFGASVAGELHGKVDLGVSGLFAAGQSMGGLFGANRLGSTSLTEGAVFGLRSGEAAAKNSIYNPLKLQSNDKFLKKISEIDNILLTKGKYSSSSIKKDIQKACWKNLGPIRDKKRLNKMRKLIELWKKKIKNIRIEDTLIWNQSFIEYIEVKNMIDTAEIMLFAAEERNGSIGGHVRIDCKNISMFSKPYSTVVNINNDKSFNVKRVYRNRTPLKRMLFYKLEEIKRLLEAKTIRFLPLSIKDKILEKKYKNIMENNDEMSSIYPGSPEAAIGEKTTL
jgi:succinate dehydrogenase/fumarate reductase flavoprotein subunit